MAHAVMTIPALRLVLSLIATCMVSAALAAPAPWYWWYSRVDGQRHCAQHSPGAGWQKGDAPYRNLRCESDDRDRKRGEVLRFETGQPQVNSPGARPIDPLHSK